MNGFSDSFGDTISNKGSRNDFPQILQEAASHFINPLQNGHWIISCLSNFIVFNPERKIMMGGKMTHNRNHNTASLLLRAASMLPSKPDIIISPGKN